MSAARRPRRAGCSRRTHVRELHTIHVPLAGSEELAMIGSRRLEELEAEARYHRERYELYKAKTYGPRPTSDARLAELERRHQGSESRLRRARQEIAAPAHAPEEQI